MLISKRTLRILAPTCTALLYAATALAANITGTVTDRTTGRPSAGDTIAVINTAQSMDEIAKVTSDAKGNFQVNAPDGGQILLHVTHGGAEYFKSIAPGSTTAEIDVYDSAKKIDGISGEALVVRAETDTTGKTLNVAENFFVKNESSPARTEYGGNTLDFYLPKGAQVGEALASSPGGLPTNTKLTTIDAAGGHYAFTFPIRPGETRFQVAYTLPYSGKQPFSLKLSLPTGDVAVMLPKSMQFQDAAAFQPLNDPGVTTSQSYDDHQPAVAQPIVFTVAGTGQLPEDQPQGGAQAGNQGTGQPAQASSERPGGGLGAPEDPNDTNSPLAKYKWWIVTGLGLVLIAGAGIMLGKGPAAGGTIAPSAPPVDITVPSPEFATYSTPGTLAAPAAGGASLLQALKDELFELETDRLSGKLSDAQYAEHKAAFDVVLRRALNR